MTEFQVDTGPVGDIDRSVRRRRVDPSLPEEAPLPPRNWPPRRLATPRTESDEIKVHALPANGAPEVPEAREDWPFGFTTKPVPASRADHPERDTGPRIGFRRAADEREHRDEATEPEVPGA